MIKRLKTTLLAVAAVSIAVGSVALAADRTPTLVVFSANWCASCRDVVPVVQDVAGRNGMKAVIIDVDKQDAPKQAQSYSLSIPTTEPPQVYYVDGGKVVQVYNGKDFRFGYEDMVRSTLEQNIQGGR